MCLVQSSAVTPGCQSPNNGDHVFGELSPLINAAVGTVQMLINCVTQVEQGDDFWLQQTRLCQTARGRKRCGEIQHFFLSSYQNLISASGKTQVLFHQAVPTISTNDITAYTQQLFFKAT